MKVDFSHVLQNKRVASWDNPSVAMSASTDANGKVALDGNATCHANMERELAARIVLGSLGANTTDAISLSW
jgi:hypothetical protein